MKTKKIYPVLLIGLLIFFIGLLIRKIDGIQSVELKSLDWRYEMRGLVSTEDLPVLVVPIDDQSFESLPSRWPWPREYYGHLAENLIKAGAKVVAFDLVIDQPDPHGSKSDSLFARVLEKYPDQIVIAGKIEIKGGKLTGRKLSYIVPPMELFVNAGAKWGAVSLGPDVDGFYREYSFAQYVPDLDTIYSSFAAQILKSYMEIPDTTILEVKNGTLSLGEVKIPVYSSYSDNMMINYFGPPSSFQYISFDNVIDDSTFALKGDFDLDYYHMLVDDEIFKGKIILIGSSIPEHHDNFPTPFLHFEDSEGNYKIEEMPGVEIHANVLATILSGKFFVKMGDLTLHLLVLFLLSLIMFLAHKLKTLWSITSLIAILVLIMGLSILLFNNLLIVIEVVYPIITIVTGYFSINIYLYLLTKKEKQMILGAFTHYVPPKVVDDIIANPDKLALGGEEREISILFSDIASFTTISENIEPKKLVILINEYLTAMTDIILEHDGIIDKYEGDAIMAEFGVPVHYDDHPVKAVAAALNMQEALKRLEPKWKKRNYPPLYTRIGINTGNVIVGNMGSRDVFDYTAMGDNVNLAARLESANKMYGTKIMVSENTALKVENEFWLRPLDMIRVKGKQKPVKVFEVLNRKGAKGSEMCANISSVFNKGFHYYLEQDWDQAINCFQHSIKQKKEDPPSAVYLRRIYQFKKNPPPKNWDGVFTLSEK